MSSPGDPPATTDDLRLVHAVEVPKAVAAVALLVAAWILADRRLSTAEAEVFETINDLPGLLEAVLWAPMQLGSLLGPVVVALAAAFGWRRWQPAVATFVAGVVGWEAAKLVKSWVARGRPVDVLDEVVRRWGTPTEGLGFVSGHTTVAFALAGTLSPWIGRWRWLAYGVAGVVALARVHVAAHLPLDVVGGAALGLVVAELTNTLVGVPADRDHVAPRARRWRWSPR